MKKLLIRFKRRQTGYQYKAIHSVRSMGFRVLSGMAGIIMILNQGEQMLDTFLVQM